MKRLVVIFISILLLSFSPQSDKTYYATGELESEIIYDDKHRIIKILEYFKDGKKRKEDHYTDGKINGTSIFYFPNGDISVYYVYKNGTPNGRAYSNYSNGKLGYEKYYANGYKTGTWIYYNEDGSIRSREIHQLNKTKWDSQNDFKTVERFLENKPAFTEHFEHGKKTDISITNQQLYNKWLELNKSSGKNLFMANCSMCHALNYDIVGPKLANVTKYRNEKWLLMMIKNGDQLVQSNDSIAVSLYNNWDRSPHPDFKSLTDEDIRMILDYLSM